MSLELKLNQEITLERGGHHFTSVIQGWREGKYILVEFRTLGSAAQLQKDNSLIGRLFIDGKYLGFESRLLGVMSEMGLMAIQYPTDPSISTCRKTERYDLLMEITIRLGDGAHHNWPGLVTNFSGGGLELVCKAKHKKDALIEIKGAFSSGSELSWIKFRITRVKQEKDQFIYGGYFDLFDVKRHEKYINLFLDKLALYHGPNNIIQQTNKSTKGMPVGKGCNVQLGNIRANSILRGYKTVSIGSSQDDFMAQSAIIDTPIINNQPALAKKGVQCVIRYHQDGRVYGFQGDVAKQYSKPSPLWQLAISGNIEKADIRKCDRINTFILANLDIGEKSVDGAVVDISENGCGFVTAAPGPTGATKGNLKLDLPKESGFVPLNICNVRISEEQVFLGLMVNNGLKEADHRLKIIYNRYATWFK